MAEVFVLKERVDGERRVAASPETAQSLIRAGLRVAVERGAGVGANFADDDYQAVGATLVDDARSALAESDLVVSVNEPTGDAIASMRDGSVLVCLFAPSTNLDAVRRLSERGVTCASLVLLPRITRAQSMDALSSQANLAGYKAALLAAASLPKCFPLMMTAAGTVKPAHVVVLGAGVAGLQAIATARRLGAHVQASDVRLAAKEQVESLGARFIDVPGMEDLQDERGYAKPATPEFLERQRKIVGEAIADCDAVITTAQVPGRKAPRLIPSALVEQMKAGSVIVDLAAAQGGNCELTVSGRTVEHHGVTILGPSNIVSTVARHASELYARNVLSFIKPMLQEDGGLRVDLEDEIIAASLLTHGGKVIHEETAQAGSSIKGT